MIWTTAKSTEVSRRQIARPTRARGFDGAGRVMAAGTAVRVAMAGS